MEPLPFTVDSRLLQELGERLVGRPYIALAELVKNAYDADANHCEITISRNEIEVWDDGHGMTFDEFRAYWMRIGTTNKVEQAVSRKYERSLTGSKGIGRLAVQFLGREVRILTTSEARGGRCLYAEVDWEKAVEADELTKAVAHYEFREGQEIYTRGSRTGTKIILQRLNNVWTAEDVGYGSSVRNLAREIWMLQSPFADPRDENERGSQGFRIELVAEDEKMEAAFRSQMAGVFELWDTKIQGEIRAGRRKKGCSVVVCFRDGERHEVSVPLREGLIDQCDFEIRIFKLFGKQPGKISVNEAREYFKEFGGVHVYDGGFRLPYYGVGQDWLRIEVDHSHRLSISRLLPAELNVSLAMHDLPTNERIFGVVNINTAREIRRADRIAVQDGRFLKINAGRDRLLDNEAYGELQRVVRWSIDYYATRLQLRQDREVARLRPTEPLAPKLERLRETVAVASVELPRELQTRLVGEIDDYHKSVEKEKQYVERQTALLAPLAAAGLSSLAFEHESNRQFRRLERLVRRLSSVKVDEEGAEERLREVSEGLRRWMKRHQRIRSLFSSLATEEDREDVRRLKAKPTVHVILLSTRPLLRGLKAEWSGPSDMLLPLGTMADWQALLQNVFVNAANAMLDCETKLVRVSGGSSGKQKSYLQVSDTGAGVDLGSSDELFEPFVRRVSVSDERKSLGLAGMGLGLTIVRMICETRKLGYGFVEPEPGFSTTFRMTWTR